jgi:hypothetical protein
MASSTTRTNPNALRIIRERADQLTSREIHVGWSHKMDASPETVTIAAFNTLGTATIPARDALTPAVVGSLGVIRQRNVQAVHAVNTGAQAFPILDDLATELEDALHRSVMDFTTPANAPSTIAQKGRDAPLKGATDDGRIADYARAKVMNKG